MISYKNKHLQNKKIQYECTIINDKLLRVSLDIKQIYDDLSYVLKTQKIKLYDDVFNNKAVYEKLFIVKIILKNKENIRLCTIKYNELKYQSGMACLISTKQTEIYNIFQIYKNMILDGKILKGITIYSQILTEYNNLPIELKELMIVRPNIEITNLPISLRKITVIHNYIYKEYNIKCPFGCELIDIRFNNIMLY
jgi:hypothetical protein